MLFEKIKKIKYIEIVLSVLVCFLLIGLLIFLIDSFQVASETNKSNFTYTIKTRDALAKVDRIVEGAEINVNTLAAAVSASYDTRKLHDEKYNIHYLDSINVLSKAFLINSPLEEGTWFLLNVDLPFSNRVYSWYVFQNGKVIDLKKQLEKEKLSTRKLNPKDDPYYFQALKAKKVIWSDIYVDAETNTQMLTVAKSVYKNGVLIGVVGVDISVENLQQIMESMQSVFKNSEVFLLNADNNIVLSQLTDNKKNKKSDYKSLNLFAKKPQGDLAMVEFVEEGVKKTAIMLAVSTEYNVVITFPDKLLFHGFDRLFNAIYFIFLVMAALAVVAILNKRRIIKINQNLEMEKNKLRTIIDSASNAMVIKSLDGVYIDCNNKFLELSGVKREDVIGKKDTDLFVGEELKKIHENESIVKATGKIHVQEYSYESRYDKKFYVEKYIIPLFNSDGKMTELFINAFDITKRKQEEEVLQKAKETAEKVAMMKSNFLANMSHEIRTPMNGVLGFIQLLKETNTTEEQAEFIEDAQKSSEILLEIINDILDFSKIEADKLEIDNISFDIRSIVEDVMIMATSNAESKNLEINSLICSDIPQKVFGDPGRIKQILNNLVSNAIKFTIKGEIVILVKQIWEDLDDVVIAFKVKDTGIGMEQDKLDLIFEAFTQADASMTRRFGGTGLGLAISKKLAELMNGSISAESTLGEGSIFTFNIRLKKDKSSKQGINNSPEVINGKKILIIDNNQTDLMVIDYYLSELNCIMYKANSPEKALELLNQEAESISVILISYKMQNINGNELSLLIKQNENLKDIPLILYTSLAKRGDSSLVKEKGFAGFLTKPIKKYELIDALSIALNKKEENVQNKLITKHLIRENRFNSKSKILLAEDSEINCKLILKVLNNNGILCDVALNGKEAIEAFQSKKYDLILMDCQMPILNGCDATIEIRKLENNEKHVPIIAMTANALKQDEEKCYASGMDDYISKPVKIDELLRIIGKYIDIANTKIEKEDKIEVVDNIINRMSAELEFTKHEAIEFFTEYLEFLPEAVSKLESAINENDFEKLKEIAHKLKGSSASLRIEKIVQLSLEVEKKASDEDKDGCLYLISEIKSHLEYLNELFLTFSNY